MDNSAIQISLRPEALDLSLRSWSGGRVALISAAWIIVVLAYSAWLGFSAGAVSRLRGDGIEGFVVISDSLSRFATLFAVWVPPLVLVVLWLKARKPRH